MCCRVFGIAGFVSAFLYGAYSYTLGARIEKKMKERKEQVEARIKLLGFYHFSLFSRKKMILMVKL